MLAPSLASEELVARRSRRLRRELRRAAREFARQRTADTLAPLLKAAAPDWFNEEQAGAYAAEMRRLYQRLAPRTRAASA